MLDKYDNLVEAIPPAILCVQKAKNTKTYVECKEETTLTNKKTNHTLHKLSQFHSLNSGYSKKTLVS